MKKEQAIIALLVLISLIKSFGQSANPRIEQVENGLIPYVPVAGFAKWNIHDRMKYYDVQGVSIAVIRDFKVEWAKAYGMADTAQKMPMTTETMLSAGSISKMVTGFGAFQLVQNKKLALDEPINNYLKSWQLPENDFTKKTPVTLRMLLSHKAGTSQASYWGFTPDVKELPTILDILKGNPVAESRGVVVNSEPNVAFRYSGGGLMVAQMAIMDATNERFEDYTERTIFGPLSMQHSTFVQPLPHKFKKQAAWGYSAAPWYKGAPYVYPQQAAAGLYSTPTDLAKFVIDLQKAYQGKSNLLQQAGAKTMLTAQATISEGGYREQMAVSPFLLQRIDNQESKGIYFEHTGVNAGFTAYLIGNLTEGYGAVIMLNSGDDFDGLGKEIRRAIAQTYDWYKFLPEPIQPISLTENELNQYVGRYKRGLDAVVEIRREKDYLVETVREGLDEGKAIYCFPIANDTVVFTDFNIKGVFSKNTEGSVVGLKSAYQTEPMKKMADGEFLPHELLIKGDFKAAKDAYRSMNFNESRITYTVYAYMNQKNARMEIVKCLLELAEELYPKSSMVFSRWGDFYLKTKDKTNALLSYQKALALDPSNKELNETLKRLK
jgi:CubicO group peptidase (beta-lactamase class C family)